MARPGGLEFPTFQLPRQTVPVKLTLNKSFRFKEWCARGTRTPDRLVRSYAVQNSKCCFWCRLQGNAPFISLLSWTDVGLKCFWGEPLRWHSFCEVGVPSAPGNLLQPFAIACSVRLTPPPGGFVLTRNSDVTRLG